MTSAEKDAYILKLEQQNRDLLTQVTLLTKQIETLTHQIDNLQEIILQMRRDKFGSSSEKTPREDIGEQLYMPQVFNEVEVSANNSVKEPCKITREDNVRARSKGTRKTNY